MVAALALALVLTFSLISSAIATEVAILSHHKDGASSAVRSHIMKNRSGSQLEKKVNLPKKSERCIGPYGSAKEFWYNQKLCQ